MATKVYRYYKIYNDARTHELQVSVSRRTMEQELHHAVYQNITLPSCDRLERLILNQAYHPLIFVGRWGLIAVLFG